MLNIKELTKTYSSGIQALKGISIDVTPGFTDLVDSDWVTTNTSRHGATCENLWLFGSFWLACKFWRWSTSWNGVHNGLRASLLSLNSSDKLTTNPPNQSCLFIRSETGGVSRELDLW